MLDDLILADASPLYSSDIWGLPVKGSPLVHTRAIKDTRRQNNDPIYYQTDDPQSPKINASYDSGLAVVYLRFTTRLLGRIREVRWSLVCPSHGMA